MNKRLEALVEEYVQQRFPGLDKHPAFNGRAAKWIKDAGIYFYEQAIKDSAEIAKSYDDPTAPVFGMLVTINIYKEIKALVE